MRTPIFAALGAFALLSSCAPVDDGGLGYAATGARQCFSVSRVENFRQGRSDQIFLRVGGSDVYELNAAGGCPDVDFANQLALLPDGGAIGSRLCTGDRAQVVVAGSSSLANVCRARISRKLTADEIAALPASHRP